MTAMRSVAILFVTVCLVACPAQSETASNQQVRVLLDHYFGHCSRLYICADGPFTIKDDLGNLVASGGNASAYSIAWQAARSPASPSALAVSDMTYGAQNSTEDSDTATAVVTISVIDPRGTIFLGATPTCKRMAYRGSITVSALSGGLLGVVNSIALEDYVRGVVKAEIGGDAPLEAMKAQAVAARTYAIRNLGRFRQEGADVDDTNRSQNYLGKCVECASSDLAVSQTRGQVIVYNGAVIDAMYCTQCGGMTAEGPPGEPYLRPVATAACASKPGWIYTIGQFALNALLAQDASRSVGNVKRIDVGRTDVSGRALEIKLTGDKANCTIGGDAFRQLLGPDNLRSTRFTVKQDHGGSWIFAGQGWGHGMGMCQAGAVARASGPHPEDYAHILADYYPGTQITSLTPSLVPQPPLSNASNASRP